MYKIGYSLFVFELIRIYLKFEHQRTEISRHCVGIFLNRISSVGVRIVYSLK